MSIDTVKKLSKAPAIVCAKVCANQFVYPKTVCPLTPQIALYVPTESPNYQPYLLTAGALRRYANGSSRR
jgi:hypothetical protein